jgi:GTP:adenosylcobinamide-phosphate guanylyltransferase
VHQCLDTNPDAIILPTVSDEKDIIRAQRCVVKRSGDVAQLDEKSLGGARLCRSPGEVDATFLGYGPGAQYVHDATYHVRAAETQDEAVIYSVDVFFVKDHVLKNEGGS